MDRRGLPGKLRRSEREPDRVAGESGGIAAARGSRNRVGNERLRAQRELHTPLRARAEMPRGARRSLPDFIVGFLKHFLIAALLVAAHPAFSAQTILASRVWPAQEYTRVTLESEQPI